MLLKTGGANGDARARPRYWGLWIDGHRHRHRYHAPFRQRSHLVLITQIYAIIRHESVNSREAV